MTTQTVVAVYDSAIQAYSRPFFTPSSGAAVRSFGDEVNRSDRENPLWLHPEDFELRRLATFDDTTGVFTADYAVLVRGKDAKNDAQK